MLPRGTPRLHALLTVKIYLSSTLHFLEHELASHCRALNSQTEPPGDNTPHWSSFLSCFLCSDCTHLLGRYILEPALCVPAATSCLQYNLRGRRNLDNQRTSSQTQYKSITYPSLSSELITCSTCKLSIRIRFHKRPQIPQNAKKKVL